MGLVNTDDVMKRVRSYDGLKILEIGPRFGNHTRIFLRGGAEKVVCIEPRTENIKVLKEVIGDKHKVIIHAADLASAKVDGDFDLVTACGVLCHTSSPGKFLDKMKDYGNDFILITHFANETMNGATVTRSFRKQKFKGKIYSEDQREDNAESRGSIEGKNSFWPYLEDLYTLLKFTGYTVTKEEVLETQIEPLVYMELTR